SGTSAPGRCTRRSLPLGCAFFAAAGFLIHSGPGPTFGFAAADAAPFVAAFDAFGHAFLFGSVARFTASRHACLLITITYRACTRCSTRSGESKQAPPPGTLRRGCAIRSQGVPGIR